MNEICGLKPHNKCFNFFVICNTKICNISNIILYIFIIRCVVFIKGQFFKKLGALPMPKLPGPWAALDCNMQNHANCCLMLIILMLNLVTHCL